MTGQPSVDVVLHDIPVEYRERFELLLQTTLVGAESLRQQVQAYITTVRKVGPLVALIDVDEAEALAAASLVLIAAADSHPSDQANALVQAAVLYFILEEDDEEVTGVLGFDDDIQVMNAVSRGMARPDLVIPLKRKL